MTKEKKIQWLVYALLAALLAACLVFVLRPAGSSLTAVVQVGDSIVLEIPLDTAADQTFSIAQQTGLPITFEVRDHAIRFAESNCPDKVCIKAGYLSRDLDVSSCLPNQTILVVEGR